MRAALLSLAEVSGTGAERRKTGTLTRLLRAARGSEIKWLVRTFQPQMACGISLEASVLPALGIAAACEARAAGGGAATEAAGASAGAATAPCRLPSDEERKEAAATIRQAYALRPDVGALVGALLTGGVAGVRAAGTVRAGVPTQPMLAKPATSIEDVLGRMRKGGKGGGAGLSVTAEYKYDGQRCQLHRTAAGEVRCARVPSVAPARACVRARTPWRSRRSSRTCSPGRGRSVSSRARTTT